MRSGALLLLAASLLGALAVATARAQSPRTVKPPLHGRHWVAITGKPLAATAGALVFAKGGNAVDAACAMLAATCTMWDTLGWGGETQALVYDPRAKKVIGVNALGVAPTGATPAFFKAKGLAYPPEYGPLAAVTPGTPGRAHHHARRVRPPQPEGRAGARDPDGRRLPDRGPARERARAGAQAARGLAVLEGGLPPPRRGVARGAGGRRGLRPEGPRGDAAQARRGRAAGPRRRARAGGRPSRPPTTASTAGTSRRSWRAGRRSRADSSRATTSPAGR